VLLSVSLHIKPRPCGSEDERRDFDRDSRMASCLLRLRRPFSIQAYLTGRAPKPHHRFSGTLDDWAPPACFLALWAGGARWEQSKSSTRLLNGITFASSRLRHDTGDSLRLSCAVLEPAPLRLLRRVRCHVGQW